MSAIMAGTISKEHDTWFGEQLQLMGVSYWKLTVESNLEAWQTQYGLKAHVGNTMVAVEVMISNEVMGDYPTKFLERDVLDKLLRLVAEYAIKHVNDSPGMKFPITTDEA